MSAWFITGTGTDIGKTHVAAAMLTAWRAAGRSPRALKPVASGYQPALSRASDAGVLLAAMGTSASDAAVAQISPWRFADPLSPDMAAARAGRSIPFDQLVTFCRTEIARSEIARSEIARSGNPLLIEGVGGAMVPLDERHTVRDWIAALALPTIVVAGGYLGTISHTLCTIEALQARDITITALILNPRGDLPVPIEHTQASLSHHTDAKILIFGSPAWQEWVAQAQ